MRMVYLAHPYGGDPDNLKRALRWFTWVARNYRDVAPVMDWHLMCQVLEENVLNREYGLECDIEIARRCDEIWLVGGRVSAGMKRESAGHPCVRDLTALGFEPPKEPIEDPSK